MASDHRYAEWAIRLLIYLAGIASTVAGSWVASKIRIYDENRKLHHDDLKEKVLVPLRKALAESYMGLVHHASAVVSETWGKTALHPHPKLTEYPEIHGPILHVADPRNVIEASFDQALYEDARCHHLRELISDWERFRDAWTAYAKTCETWVTRMADRILSDSGLRPHPSALREPYVMQFRLAAFLYFRLFDIPSDPLRKVKETEYFVLLQLGAAALGTEEQIDGLLRLLETVQEDERHTAKELRQEAGRLERGLQLLSLKLNLAIAERKLRRRCGMVTFY